MEIEKIAQNRYRLRAHDGQVMTLSAEDVLHIMEYASTHRPQLDQEVEAEQEHQESRQRLESHDLDGEEGSEL